MWRKLAWLVLIVIGLFAGAGITWAAGVLILPEMGLRAPDYWDWFFVALLGGFGAFLRGVLTGAGKALNAWSEDYD